MNYFENLNYTLSNEDTRVENHLLKSNANRVFSICGSGARVLPLIAKNPKELDCVDLSIEQLYLCELRLSAAKTLSHEEYLYFLGYRGGIPSLSTDEDDRYELFLKLDLSDDCKDFWASKKAAWAPRGYIFLGKWESHFQRLGKIFRNYLRLDMRPIFEAHSMSEQLQLFDQHWKPLIFSAFLRVTANEFVFNKFLYKGHFSGASKHRTETRPPYQFIEEEFTRIFTSTLVRKNYFMQILFLGGIYYEEGLPLEAHPATLQGVRQSKTKVNYIRENLLDVLKTNAYDFISLSDTISYLPELEAGQILQSLPAKTPSGSKMVIRSFLRSPTEIDTTGWTRETKENEWARRLDTTAVYEFHIFGKK